ncbi:MAG: alanine racemase [Verrucomicrobiaceae bacterium]|nr:alanine racemase [Verrucomicrobiaceae bacterium]
MDAIRPTHVESIPACSRKTLRRYRRMGKVEGMPVVKANAYGHGIVECAPHLVKQGATCWACALEEAVMLRQAGIAVLILVLAVRRRGDPASITHGLMMTASSIDKLREIDEAAAAAKSRARVALENRHASGWSGSACIVIALRKAAGGL